MATVTIEIRASVEQSLKLTAAKSNISFELYLARLIEDAGRQNEIVPVADNEQDDEDEERPWRGIFAPARPRRPLCTFDASSPESVIPKRSAVANMNWHCIESDDE